MSTATDIEAVLLGLTEDVLRAMSLGELATLLKGASKLVADIVVLVQAKHAEASDLAVEVSAVELAAQIDEDQKFGAEGTRKP